MKRLVLGAALGAAVLSFASPALAGPFGKGWHEWEEVRFGVRGETWAGTRREGAGSVARLRLGAADFELVARRFFAGPIGFSIALAFLPPASAFEGVSYLRGDASLDVGLARWGGVVPGAFVVGAGFGGDLGRYAFGGRFYPRLEARLRLRPSKNVGLFAATDVMPAAVGPDDRVFQVRTEIGFVWRLLIVGLRAGHTWMTGGVPERTYFQQELGLYVGVGVM
jgi:hypothetical protein